MGRPTITIIRSSNRDSFNRKASVTIGRAGGAAADTKGVYAMILSFVYWYHACIRERERKGECVCVCVCLRPSNSIVPS